MIFFVPFFIRKFSLSRKIFGFEFICLWVEMRVGILLSVHNYCKPKYEIWGFGAGSIMLVFAQAKQERDAIQKQLIRTQNIYSVEVNQTTKPIWMMPALSALIGLSKKERAALITDMARNDFEKQGGVDRPVCSTGSMESCRPVLGSERFDVPSREYSTLREPCDHWFTKVWKPGTKWSW